MNDREDLDPCLLALARALGRHQAHQDLAQPAVEPSRTSDIVEGQVALNKKRSFDGAETVEYDL